MQTKRQREGYCYLSFGNIQLFPVEGTTDKWHVPGRTIRSTKELVKLADKRRITILRTETSGEGSNTVVLN